MSPTEKTLSYILKGGLLLTPFLVLVVTRPLYFPFITGKNFIFRMLVEILAAVWVVAAVRFKNLRPRLSPLLWTVTAFVAIMGLATIFSLSPYRSFWSNFERMEGYLGLLHFFLYFLLLISVFKSERDWRTFFYTSLGVSVIISIYSVLQLAGKLDIHQGGTRVDATLGNATYLAAYLLFHLFFAIWFFLNSRNLGAKIAFAGIFILESFILYHTATRGALLGFLGGLVVLSLILAFSAKGRSRQWSLAVLGVLVLIPVVFFLARHTSLVKKSPVLSRFSAISLQETTTQSRFTIWGMALKGWQNRPILGWGQDSFLYVFSKYYDPSLWRQEPWFDRAHNIFLDWLTAGGILGLASYLSIYAAAVWILWNLFRKGVVGRVSFAVLTSLAAAHFFQNIFVFDNLTSYLLFFGVLGYIHSAEHFEEDRHHPHPANRSSPSHAGLEVGLAVVAGAALILMLYFANIKPMATAASILDGLRINGEHAPAGRVDAVIAAFKEGLDLNTFGTMEVREQISQAAAFILRDPAIATQDKAKYIEFAIGEMEKQVKDFPSDMRAKAFLATIYSSAGRSQDAIGILSEAFKVSDRRPQFYFIAGEAYLNANQPDKAAEVMRRAYELAPDYPEAVANLATVLILAKKDKEVEGLFMKHFGAPIVFSERYAQAYIQAGRADKALAIWKKIVEGNPGDAQSHANLGSVYFQAGDKASAIQEFEEAIRLEPKFKEQGEEIIKRIRGGQ